MVLGQQHAQARPTTEVNIYTCINGKGGMSNAPAVDRYVRESLGTVVARNGGKGLFGGFEDLRGPPLVRREKKR